MPAQAHLALFIRSLAGSGPGRMLVNLSRAFAERGHVVDLVLAQAKGPYLHEVPDSVRVVDLQTPTVLQCLPLIVQAPQIFGALAPALLDVHAPRVLGSIPALARYLRRERPTAILSAQHYGNIAALAATRLASVQTRLVITQRTHLASYVQQGKKRRKRLVTRLLRRFYPWADAIVTVSEGVAEDLALTASLPRERITTIYNPVVTPALAGQARAPLTHPWFAPGSPPVLLAVGRLHYQKDFPTLLRAFARVRAVRAVRLLILGEGDQGAALQASAQELGLTTDVELPGFVLNPFAYMARAAVFVLSSAYEGLPGVLIQALACGCPVVSTDCPSGPAEILEGGVYGPLVPVGDDVALAKAILSTLNARPNPDWLRTRAAEFSVDRAVDRYLEVLLRSQ